MDTYIDTLFAILFTALTILVIAYVCVIILAFAHVVGLI